MTVAPTAANLFADSNPKPVFPPVITIVLPCNGGGVYSSRDAGGDDADAGVAIVVAVVTATLCKNVLRFTFHAMQQQLRLRLRLRLVLILIVLVPLVVQSSPAIKMTASNQPKGRV